MIEPWARTVSALMLADVARKDAKMWRQNSKEISAGLRQLVESAPVGDVLRRLQDDQVKLIQSIPTAAADRVHELSLEATVTGTRAEDLAKKILETENVTTARAALIARTEVSRAGANLLQARAEWAGSQGYIWRTSGDANVRDSHKEMEGRYVRWSSPPTLDKLTGHAGALPNCRCFAEPVFAED
jgi:SPP1 gp7 family putative phage head morphogenesis protein